MAPPIPHLWSSKISNSENIISGPLPRLLSSPTTKMQEIRRLTSWPVIFLGRMKEKRRSRWLPLCPRWRSVRVGMLSSSSCLRSGLWRLFPSHWTTGSSWRISPSAPCSRSGTTAAGPNNCTRRNWSSSKSKPTRWTSGSSPTVSPSGHGTTRQWLLRPSAQTRSCSKSKATENDIFVCWFYFILNFLLII